MRMHPPIPIRRPLTGPVRFVPAKPGRLKGTSGFASANLETRTLRVLAWLIQKSKALQQTQGPSRFVGTGLFYFVWALCRLCVVAENSAFATRFGDFRRPPAIRPDNGDNV